MIKRVMLDLDDTLLDTSAETFKFHGLENPFKKSETFYQGIQKLEAAHFVTIKNNLIVNPTKYWSINLENKEGFVLKFENSFRVKVKFDEYVKLHRIVTGTSNIAIWEYMQEGKSIADLLEKVPDEFYEWVKNTQAEIQSKFDEISGKKENRM